MTTQAITEYKVNTMGYEVIDQEEMITAVQSVLTTVNPEDDPWLYNNLKMTEQFLHTLWEEGYFD
jgi:hypothetical protein